MSIKHIMMVVATIATLGIVGCDKLPTPEKMTAISKSVGKAAGYVCEVSKVKPEVKNAVLAVLDTAVKVVPAEGKTFTEAWAPIIDEEIKKLVAAGKLDNASANIVKTALTAATEGIDYIFVKYPKALGVKELVSAAVDGFVDGFKSVVKMTLETKSIGEKTEIDEDAYKYLKAKMAARK